MSITAAPSDTSHPATAGQSGAVQLAGALAPLIISAPFGNYIQPGGATPTLGTFTAEERPGRWMQVLRTVRWYPRIGAWVNKIGLRNPGIDWLVKQVAAGGIDPADKILSIHGFADDDWWKLLDAAASIRPLAVELNMSCPNIGHINWPDQLFSRAMRCGTPVIIKLPPVNYREMARAALDAGLRAFHCCNTIPIPAGGLSGKPLKPLSIQCIGEITAMTNEPLTIIGGGGITTPQDVDDYFDAGATCVAVGTKVMNPFYLWTHAGLFPIMQRARERASALSRR